MPNSNTELIERFYRAFQERDAEGMAACYAPDIRFQDPAFGLLHGREVGDMWRMLLGRAADFSLTVDEIRSIGQTASAVAIARYTYSATGRPVVNRIESRFAIRDGFIVEHIDTFDLWRWSRQALGASGLLLGWTPRMRATIQKKARRALSDYRNKAAT
ncbi:MULTISPECIES: nuclear transport factor 2 family protein [unclassified Caballeronia]|jgi:ketosteroid isomerase-like protein|uniref:nuclear transport factor 2 family protein n=1 Tax=unclassified Caballeronia TaxID=2646786 RepID=UPI002028DA92|nr:MULTISPECIES: nuclear transport factor 2 family protein [unclassified Caballeronia]MDR5775314.1 nuclear transport factor 2 family protein [Caballeronia sp. LZ002]MDR5850752.1 nuclear transport factor 2 family protein [Caballeronia sp. LZ003]